jgi:serine protease
MSRRFSSWQRFNTWLRMEPLEDRTTPTAIVADPNSFATDRVIVSLGASTNPASVGLSSSPLAAGVQSIGLGLYQVNLREGVSVGQAISTFSGANGVVFVEPDYTLGVQLTPNDTNYTNGSLWGLNNTGQSGGTADADIDAPEAWDTARGTGATIVAVIDSGVDYNHPDLNANMWRNPNETASDGIDNDNNGFVDDVFGADFANNDGNPMDDNNHGTHVAGTIGAVGNNGLAVTGVAWTTRIIALKFLSASGGGSTSNAIRAIDYAINNGAKILNNSWGGGGYSLSLDQAIQRARNAGVIFVAAAGNSSSNNDATANYPSNYAVNNVVAVASTTRTDGLSSFSSYGATTVDLGAPGSNILSTTPNNTYSTFSGTSMATPHVAGALAVFWDANPSLTYDQVIQKLFQSVDPIASLAGKTVTGGRLNLKKLLDLGGGSPPPPPPPADVAGARITASVFAGQVANSFDRVRLTFNEAINAASFTTADIVTLVGPGGVAIAPTGISLVSGTNNQFDVSFATQSGVGGYSITVGPGILDLAGNGMDQNQNGVNGESADTYSVGGNIAPARTVFAPSTALPAAIRDNQTTTISFVVPANSPIGSFSITDLNVTLSATHTYTNDLRITLTSPGGTVVTLFNRRGGSGDNLTGTTFDDEAGVSIANGAAPFSGAFRPETVLSTFDGKSAVGTWKLSITDLATQDSGNVTAASISIAVGPGGLMVQTLGTNDDDTRTDASALKSGLVGFLRSDFVSPPTLFSPTNSDRPIATREEPTVPLSEPTVLQLRPATAVAPMLFETMSAVVIDHPADADWADPVIVVG